MPFLKHILEPQLRQAVEKLKAELPPPEATVQEAKADAAKNAQLEQWVAKKHAEYVQFGASPEQLAQWDDFNRHKYAAFLSQPPVPDRTEPQAKNTAASTLGPRGRNIAMEANMPVAPGYVDAVGSLPSTGGFLAFKRGALGMVPTPEVAQMQQAERVPEPTPKAPEKTNKRGQRTLDLPEGAVGTTETGESVDARGKKLGYLRDTSSPYRYADRIASDVSLQDRDAFAQQTLEQIYGPALQDVKDNEGKYPAGYFQDASPDTKSNIKAGVYELMKREHGERL